MRSPPTTIAVRDATVGPESGTNARVLGAISTASYGTPSSAATSCGKIVLVPCPISVEPVRMTIRPSPVSSSDATDAETDLARAREAGAVPGERQPDAVRAPATTTEERRAGHEA